jgi:hypothetical protein
MMNPAPLGYVFSAALVLLGTWFAWHESRSAADLPNVAAAARPFAASRVRRRLRIAVLFIFIGLLLACGHATDPQLNPLRYVVIWGMVTLFSFALLVYAYLDLRALRTHWQSEVRRRAAPEKPSGNTTEDSR